jgi:L-rhamnose mutarotase
MTMECRPAWLVVLLVLSLALVTGCQTMTRVNPVYGPTNPTADEAAKAKVKRYGSVVELLPEKEKQYRELHAAVWPDVVKAIKKANIQNFNIYVAEINGKKYLFSYMEYAGNDPDKDFASIGLDKTTKEKWWPITDACQNRMPGTPAGKQWLGLEMLMHIE